VKEEAKIELISHLSEKIEILDITDNSLSLYAIVKYNLTKLDLCI